MLCNLKLYLIVWLLNIERSYNSSGHKRLQCKKALVKYSLCYQSLNYTRRVPVEGKSSMCLLCMKYRIIIVIIIISLGQIFYRILQTHHACTHARVHTRTRAHACARTHTRPRAHARANTRAHTQPWPPSPSEAQSIAIHRRPAVIASPAGIHRGAPFIAGSRVIEINNTRKPPDFPDNLEVFRV